MIESKYQLSLGRLDEALRAAAVPYAGYSPRPAISGETPHFTENGVGYFVELHFPDSATPAQRQQLVTIRDGWTFTVRRTRTRAALLTAIQGLSTADRNRLINGVLVEFLFDHPRFAEQIGINLVGDEPDI